MDNNLTNIEFNGVLKRSTVTADGEGIFTLSNQDEVYDFLFTYDNDSYKFTYEGMELPTYQLDELERKIQNFSETIEVEEVEDSTDWEDMQFTYDCLRDPHLYI